MPRTPKETIPSQFRLKKDTLDDLDMIAKHLTETTGIEHTRTDAIRYAARQAAKEFGKKPPRSKKNA